MLRIRPGYLTAVVSACLGVCLCVGGCATLGGGGKGGPLTLNTPVERICSRPDGKAVLDRDLPGLTDRPEYVFFSGLSLRQLQPMSKGQLSEADLAKVAADLAKLP